MILIPQLLDTDQQVSEQQSISLHKYKQGLILQYNFRDGRSDLIFLIKKYCMIKGIIYQTCIDQIGYEFVQEQVLNKQFYQSKLNQLININIKNKTSQMDLLGDPHITRQPANKQQANKSSIQSASNLLSQQWKSQQDYKRDIINLQIENEKYRNELYELGETVNKILDKVKVPTKAHSHTPNLEQQLELVKKELHNVNQFIDIYQKELSALGNKKKKDQVESLASTQQVLKSKAQELATLKKQVKQLSHKNKGLQYKLLEYSKKGKVKSADQQALQLKQLINENKSLKNKLQELQALHERKQKWLQSNIESAKELEKRVHDQEIKLPKIESVKAIDYRERSATSLPKLQSEKKIYTKWLQTASNSKKNSVIEKELGELEKINRVVQDKIAGTSAQIHEIEQQIERIKARIESQEDTKHETQPRHEEQSTKLKKKHAGTMVAKKTRKLKKDWVGRFDGLRFSDNRYIREECRLYKVTFNSNGYCQFFYYSVKDNKRRFNSKLPFDAATLLNHGKDSTFTVESPDFIKNIRLKINLKTHRITQISLVSNLGIQAEFIVDTNLHSLTTNAKNTQKVSTNQKEEQPEVNYEMDIKANEAITCLFGSYGTRLDQKKQVTNVWLQGLGAQIIEDFVEELI